MPDTGYWIHDVIFKKICTIERYPAPGILYQFYNF